MWFPVEIWVGDKELQTVPSTQKYTFFSFSSLPFDLSPNLCSASST